MAPIALGVKIADIQRSLLPRLWRCNRTANLTAHESFTTRGVACKPSVDVVLNLFMAVLSFREFDTPSLQAQGEQRRSSYFNIGRGNSAAAASTWPLSN